MGLKDTIKEIKNEIEEEEKKENEESEDKQDEEHESTDGNTESDGKEAEESKNTDEKTEEKAIEEPAKAESKEAEEKPDSAAFQRMRREAAAAKKRADEAEAKLAEINKPAEKDEEQEDAVNPELAEIVEGHRLSKAEEEFKGLEAKFSKINPEYENISKEYTLALAQSIKIQNPRLSNESIVKKTKETLLRKAAGYMQQGYDPIEEMFHEAKELGFTGKSMQKEEPKQETEEKEEIKPDMAKIAKNRAKSAGMAASSGKSEGMMTKAAATELSVAEWSKLSKAEKHRLLNS